MWNWIAQVLSWVHNEKMIGFRDQTDLRMWGKSVNLMFHSLAGTSNFAVFWAVKKSVPFTTQQLVLLKPKSLFPLNQTMNGYINKFQRSYLLVLYRWSIIQGFSLASAIGHSPKMVPDVREFAVQFGQFVRDDFQKRILYGNAQWCDSIFVL